MREPCAAVLMQNSQLDVSCIGCHCEKLFIRPSAWQKNLQAFVCLCGCASGTNTKIHIHRRRSQRNRIWNVQKQALVLVWCSD